MTERIRRILRGKNITPKTADEAAVKYAIANGGGGGGILRVPFALTITQEGISGETDAVFADVLAKRKNGKVIVAAAAMDFGNGMVQYIDGVMCAGDAGANSFLRCTVCMLDGDGTKLEAYDIKWDASGVTMTKKEASVS